MCPFGDPVHVRLPKGTAQGMSAMAKVEKSIEGMRFGGKPPTRADLRKCLTTEKLLADPRFAAQRSPDSQPTSFFRLTSPSWEFVGLDTSWDHDVLSTGAVAVLEDPQAEYVAKVAGESARKLVLFSHHQLTSVYDQHDIGPELGRKLAPVLTSGRVTAWWWGHEHRAMTFKPFGGVQYPRCLGNGSVPVLRGPAMTEAIRQVADWDSRRYIWSGLRRWTRFGFAVLDLAGESIDVRYRDDDGKQAHCETVR